MKTWFCSISVLASALVIAAAPAIALEHKSRLYAGVGVAQLQRRSDYNGVLYEDGSAGFNAYGGYRLRDYLAIELAIEHYGRLDSANLAGSGTDRLDISGRLDSATVRSVVSLPLSDFLHWNRKLQLLGALGYGETHLRRNVLELNSGTLDSAPELKRGTTLGLGVLYGLPKVGLRGYLEQLGTNHARPSTELNLAVEFKF